MYNLKTEVEIMISENNIRITITIPKSIHKLLKSDACYEDRSVGNLVSRILKQYYKVNVEE